MRNVNPTSLPLQCSTAPVAAKQPPAALLSSAMSEANKEEIEKCKQIAQAALAGGDVGTPAWACGIAQGCNNVTVTVHGVVCDIKRFCFDFHDY